MIDSRRAHVEKSLGDKAIAICPWCEGRVFVTGQLWVCRGCLAGGMVYQQTTVALGKTAVLDGASATQPAVSERQHPRNI